MHDGRLLEGGEMYESLRFGLVDSRRRDIVSKNPKLRWSTDD